jgi:hypothetical protein
MQAFFLQNLVIYYLNLEIYFWVLTNHNPIKLINTLFKKEKITNFLSPTFYAQAYLS